MNRPGLLRLGGERHGEGRRTELPEPLSKRVLPPHGHSGGGAAEMRGPRDSRRVLRVSSKGVGENADGGSEQERAPVHSMT